jgi:ankyrin repeat protein
MGADVAAKNNIGKTALHWAAESGHETVVGLLLERGADPMAKDIFEENASHQAAKNKHEAVVQLLLQKENRH